MHAIGDGVSTSHTQAEPQPQAGRKGTRLSSQNTDVPKANPSQRFTTRSGRVTNGPALESPGKLRPCGLAKLLILLVHLAPRALFTYARARDESSDAHGMIMSD